MEVGIVEAGDSLAQLVDRAEAGETVTLTRDGRPVVVLSPAQAKVTVGEAERIFRDLEPFRSQMPNLTSDDIVAMINEGRRY